MFVLKQLNKKNTKWLAIPLNFHFPCVSLAMFKQTAAFKIKPKGIHHHHHHHHHLSGRDRAFTEISSQTPRFTIAVLRSLVSNPESLAITSGYVSLSECTVPAECLRMSDEIISSSANNNCRCFCLSLKDGRVSPPGIIAIIITKNMNLKK